MNVNKIYDELEIQNRPNNLNYKCIELNSFRGNVCIDLRQ